MSSEEARRQIRETTDAITETPRYFPDCCCSISKGLLRTLGNILADASGYVISIGCGSGILEALLSIWLERQTHSPILGLEVEGRKITALPENLARYVPGTYAIHPLAEVASIWIFVYPREPGLLRKYLSEYGHREVKKIIWLGPRADWLAFVHVVNENKDWAFTKMIDGSGIASYELLIVLYKRVGGAG